MTYDDVDRVRGHPGMPTVTAVRRLVLVGAGGFAGDDRTRSALNRVDPTFDLVGYLDDDPALAGQVRTGLPVVGPLEWIHDHPDVAGDGVHREPGGTGEPDVASWLASGSIPPGSPRSCIPAPTSAQRSRWAPGRSSMPAVSSPPTCGSGVTSR